LKRPVWIASATILEVHDGDTIKAVLDLGFRISYTTFIRVAGVNAPELPTAQGYASQHYLRTLLKPGDVVTCRSKRLDKYGRSVCYITRADGSDVGAMILSTGHGLSVNDMLQPAPYNLPDDLAELPEYGKAETT
jgi:endonuclease YncB( thermonuclease family)